MRTMLTLSLLALGLLCLAGCPAGDFPAELGDCPDGSTVTWDTVQPIFEANCNRCHSSTLVDAQRQAAPEGWDYDSRADAIRDPDETWTRIWTDNMPNDADFDSDVDRGVLWEWYSCDAPE